MNLRASTKTTTKAERCWLRCKPFYQCCCNCKHHWQDNHHCTIHKELRKDHGGCICSIKKGYICVGFRAQGDGSESVFSEWPKHSVGCEMYTPIKMFKRP